MAQNSHVSYTFAELGTAGASSRHTGGPCVIASSITYAASSVMKWEVQTAAGSWVDLYDINGSAVSESVDGAASDAYFCVWLPSGATIRPNVTSGEATSGDATISVALPSA